MLHCDGMAAWLFTKKLWGHVYVEHLVDIFFFLPGNIRRRDVTCFNVLNQLSVMKTGRGCTIVIVIVVNLCDVKTCISWAWIKYFCCYNLDFKMEFLSTAVVVCYCFCLHSHFSTVLPVTVEFWWNPPILETKLTKIPISWAKNHRIMTEICQFLTKTRNNRKITFDSHKTFVMGRNSW